MGELTSEAIAPPSAADHRWGRGASEAIIYLDLACPRCAVTWSRVRDLPLGLCLRHFPIASKRPRAPVLHAAVEAAGNQGRFAELWDLLLVDPGHTDDPYIWRHAQDLGLEFGRFERERRSEAVAARVREKFEGAIRGGVTGTPAAVIEGRLVATDPETALIAYASGR